MYLQHNRDIYYRQWPVLQARAVLLIAHGLGEHSARYKHVARFFNQQDIAVYAIDHRGHGESAGFRGHIEDFSHFSEDLHLLAQQLRLQYPAQPIHLLGHSMGGLIATGYALRHDSIIDSLVLSAPAYGVQGLGNKLSLKMAPLLALLAPTMGMANGLDVQAISRDPSVVKAYQDDPLVHDRVTPTWAAAFGREQRYVARELNRLSIPVLMLVAGSDRLTDPAVATALFEKITAAKKKLTVYPQAYHEIFNEPEQLEALQAVQDWLTGL